MTILYNELLFKDEYQTIFKTVNNKKDLYGMYSDKYGIIEKPNYMHIFEFAEFCNYGVVITQNEEFLGIMPDGKLFELDADVEREYKLYLIKASKCNCYYSKENFKHLHSNSIKCGLCDDYNRLIYNRFGDANNFRSWKK